MLELLADRQNIALDSDEKINVNPEFVNKLTSLKKFCQCCNLNINDQKQASKFAKEEV